ncbi:MAG: Lanthionine biosynthesis protein LanB [uncultured Corynebacteriales bacterium]|uniref:Lanthionine biosynthesis protein LanB n=1 Tax=uncultured Mycobacteriales bacterium TaxID=581187 RepID=A0A6J4JPU8_9ACTN|nr:MAG: Lanthionine biosynthesis protein LanB [uncultured Corynebacteriales bacterium]
MSAPTTTGRTGPAAGDRSTPTGLAGRFVARVAGLPVETVEPLRSAAARDWAQDVLTRTERLAAAGADLSEPLGALVKATEDDARRRRLLALRRAVFKGTAPADAAELAAGVPGDTGVALRAWLDERAALDALLAGGEDLLAGELARTRGELRAIVAREDRLRAGIVLASPTLDGQLGAYAGRAGTPDKKGRRIERSVLSYLYRTACKASPFSTFTAVGTGTFGPGGGTGATGGAAPVRMGEWTGFARLNVVVLMRLAELVAAAPALRADLPVEPSAGWAADGDRVRFVRRTVTAGDDDASVSFDAAQDRLFFLRRSGVLDRMLTMFARRGPVRLGELVDWLGADADAPAEEAGRYVGALLDLGMLQLPSMRTDVHDPDPVASFQRALRAVGTSFAAEVAAALDGPRAAVAAYPEGDPETRRRLLAELRAGLAAVLRLLGDETATLPQVLLYEDVRAEVDTAGCGRDDWARLAEEPLRELTRILPAFDVSLPQRLTLKGFFLARYGAGGRCADLLKFVHDFHEDLFDQYLTFTADQPPTRPDGSPRPEENWLGVPELTMLDTARAELIARMRETWAATAPDAAELALGEDTVRAVADLLPPSDGFTPHSHFVQRAGDRLVLNNSYGGLAFPFTRFTHTFGADVVAELRRTLAGTAPGGALFAEVTAGFATTNLNLHSRLLEHEIICPGETSSAPAEQRLDLDDLVLEHDPAADRLVLRSVRLGREIIPLYLGYLVPMVLPEIPRTLLLLSPISRAVVDVWRGVPTGPERAGVTYRPRVTYRSLVLSRRAWRLVAAALPPAGGTDAERFLAWQRWRRAHGLPARAYVTVRQPGAGWTGGTKPQWVDFDSPLSLVALDGLVRDPAALVMFEEALPDTDDPQVVSEHGRHVAEFAVEVLG